MFESLGRMIGRIAGGAASGGSSVTSQTIPDYGIIPGWRLGSNPSLGNIISAILPYVYVIAGLLMFINLVIGGLNLITSGGNAEGVKTGVNKIVSALIGFLIIFASYFIIQIVEVLFHISILG